MIDDLDLAWEEQHDPRRQRRGGPPSRQARQRRRKERKRRRRSFGALFISVILLGALGFGTWWGVGKIQDFFGAADYTGQVSATKVNVVVKPGDTATAIGNELFNKKVVKSAKAFIIAAGEDARSKNIQPGTYALFQQMPAKQALAMLLDPAKYKVVTKVTIPEGLITVQIFQKLSEVTKIPVANFVNAAKDPVKVGVPDFWFNRSDGKQAAKSLEGFLFPATYELPPGATAEEILGIMVQKFLDVTTELKFVDTVQAERGGIMPYEALITASIAEAEALTPTDQGKVARVVYNRVYGELPCKCMQLERAINYWFKVQGKNPKDPNVFTQAEIHNKSNPYNTHDVAGLPRSPIGNPGENALKAAMRPPNGTWTYFVTIDKKGTTLFSSDYASFQRDVRKACTNGVLTGESCL